MGKFIVHGVLVEEPKRTTTSNGIDCVTLLVEEKFRTSFNKEVINLYSIDFMGKAVNCVPENVRLVGAPVVITGTIRGREYKEKYYNDLMGDALTIIDTNSFVSEGVSNSARPKPSEPKEEIPVDTADELPLTPSVEEDDLPF